MKLRLEGPSDRKHKWIRYLFGTYTLSNRNKNNTKIESKFLKVLGFISIIFFIFFMLFSFFFLGSLAYYKYQAKEPTIMDKTSALGLVLPSINTNTLDDVQADYQKVSSREMEIKDMKKRFLIFLPWFIFIPLILLVTSIHEYGHYIMCRRAGVHVNRYGLACVSIFSIPLPLFAGFVEPAKTYMDKTSKFNFFSIISAGVSLNVLLGIILLIIPYSYFSYLGFIFNLGVGMINVLPLGFLDGGQFIGRISSKLNWVTSIVSALLLALLL